jgi:addiction module HigA family antidote
MLPELSKIKGIHPGIILKRELKLLGLKNYEFALAVDEFPQTISAIIKGKRGITPILSIAIGKQLQVDADYFMMLQASHEVSTLKQSINSPKKPNTRYIRKGLFWDSHIDKIDWQTNKKAVLKRVFERGNEQEIHEVIQFYGKEEIKHALSGLKNHFLPSYFENLRVHKIFQE